MRKTISLIFLFCVLFLPFFVLANPIVADLAVRSVDIDHDFDGMDMLMFGAQNDVGRIVVALRGPKKKYVVRKKDRFLGMWVNRKAIEFDGVSNLYALASTRPFDEIRNDNLLGSLELGLDNLKIRPAFKYQNEKSEVVEEFRKALIDQKKSQGLYSADVERISFWGETLFRTLLYFPENISEGWYTSEVYLFSDGLLTAVQSTPIHVNETGIAAYISDVAYNNSLLYGIICVFMALFAGWAASVVFGRI